MRKITYLLLLCPIFIFAQVSNGTFDADINGWVGQNNPASMTWSATEGHNSSGSIMVVAANGTNSGIKSDPNVVVSEGAGNYIFSAWVKGTAGDKVQLFVFHGSSMNLPQYTLSSNNWELVTGTFNNLDATTNTTVRVVGKTTGMTFYVDDITFVKEPCSGYEVTTSNNFAGFSTITNPLSCYATGNVLELTATPSCSEFTLDHWEVNSVSVGNTNPFNFTVGTENVDVKAVFSAVNSTVDRNFDTDAELNAWIAATDASVTIINNDLIWSITGGSSKLAYNSCAFAPTTWNFNAMKIGYTNNSSNTRIRLKYAKQEGGFEYINVDGLITNNTPQILIMPLTNSTWTDFIPDLELLMRADDLNTASTNGTFTIDYIEFYYDAALSNITFVADNNAIIAFPNPAKNSISFSSTKSEIKLVNIYDITGKLVFVNMNSNFNNISVSELNNGIYFAKVGLENGAIETVKFVKN